MSVIELIFNHGGTEDNEKNRGGSFYLDMRLDKGIREQNNRIAGWLQ